MLFQAALAIALPFWLLVRGSVAVHTAYGTNGWISLLPGIVLSTLCLAAWIAWLSHRITGRHRFRQIAIRVALPGVFAFCLYSLVWLSSLNAKSPEIRALYTHLHPSLRLAIGTATLADSDVVITDITRSRDDYARMGLSPRERSLHYEQSDGWVHAVDLRTRGRSDWRNALSQLVFRSMGFRVLRHGGTGDHLHVALPPS